jgi:hypothetical protein
MTEPESDDRERPYISQPLLYRLAELVLSLRNATPAQGV